MSEVSSSKNDEKSSKSSKKSSSRSKSNQNESVNQSQKVDNKSENNQPEQITSTRAYLESTVTAVVQEGMLELAKTRPDNPLEFLGNFILNKAKEK
jgi:protein dpy-30